MRRICNTCVEVLFQLSNQLLSLRSLFFWGRRGEGVVLPLHGELTARLTSDLGTDNLLMAADVVCDIPDE